MKTQVKMAARVKPGDLLVIDQKTRPWTVAVRRVERARGRKPKKGETLILHVGKRYPLRINSLQPVRVQAVPAVATHLSPTP